MQNWKKFVDAATFLKYAAGYVKENCFFIGSDFHELVNDSIERFIDANQVNGVDYELISEAIPSWRVGYVTPQGGTKGVYLTYMEAAYNTAIIRLMIVELNGDSTIRTKATYWVTVKNGGEQVNVKALYGWKADKSVTEVEPDWDSDEEVGMGFNG